jgi:hypothetical protein
VSVIVGTLSGMDEQQMAEWIAPSRFGEADAEGNEVDVATITGRG